MPRVAPCNPPRPIRSRPWRGETEHGVKFLCDRCKTRYSIGDDRVRGKILKIRCKNCANVITVREGMVPDADGAPGDAAARARQASTAATEARDELDGLDGAESEPAPVVPTVA